MHESNHTASSFTRPVLNKSRNLKCYLYSTLPVKKVKHLGGKFGSMVCTTLKIATMGELKKFSVKELQKKFDEKNG